MNKHDFMISFLIALCVSVFLYNKYLFCNKPFTNKKCNSIMCKFSGVCSCSRFHRDVIDEEEHHD